MSDVEIKISIAKHSTVVVSDAEEMIEALKEVVPEDALNHGNYVAMFATSALKEVHAILYKTKTIQVTLINKGRGKPIDDPDPYT